MTTADTQSALQDLAEAQVREQLGRDLRDAQQPGTRTILEYLRDTDSILELDGRRLPGSSGRVPSRDAQTFHRELGHEPREYLLQLKMDAAGDLLRQRHLKVWEIAEAVCYSSLSSFSRAFRKVHGVSASAMKKQLEPAAEAIPAAVSVDVPADDHFWYAATCGILAIEDLGPLTARLRELAAIEASEIVCFQSRGSKVEAKVAGEIWQSLEPLTWRQRQARLRRTFRTNSPAFFHLLGRYYENAIVRDPRASQWLADLALVHVEANADRLGPVAPFLEALAWARRGYALYRRAVPVPRRPGAVQPALDWIDIQPEEVRQTFEQGWCRWRAAPREVDQGEATPGDRATAEAHLCLYEGEFLQSIAETEEALTRVNRAIVLARLQGPTQVLVRALVRRLILLSGIVSVDDVIAEANLVLAELRRLKQGVQAILVYALLAQTCEAAGHTYNARRYTDLVNQSLERLERGVARRKRRLQQEREPALRKSAC